MGSNHERKMHHARAVALLHQETRLNWSKAPR